MDKIRSLRITNLVLLIVITVQAVTGLMLFFELALAGVIVIHKFNALLLIAAVAAHLVLNWTWVRVNLFTRG